MDNLHVQEFHPVPVRNEDTHEPEPQETMSDKLVAYALTAAVGLAFFLAFFG